MGEVELAEHAGADLGDHGGEVVGLERVDARVELAGEEAEKGEIGLDDARQAGALDLDRDLAAVVELGEIDLGEGGGGGGFFVELGEHVRDRASEGFLEDGPHLGEGEGGDVAAQLAQLDDERGRQGVGPHAEQLAGLDEGGAELLERLADADVGGAALGGARDEALPETRRQFDLVEQLAEAGARGDADDLLGADGVGDEGEGGHGSRGRGARRGEREETGTGRGATMGGGRRARRPASRGSGLAVARRGGRRIRGGVGGDLEGGDAGLEGGESGGDGGVVAVEELGGAGGGLGAHLFEFAAAALGDFLGDDAGVVGLQLALAHVVIERVLDFFLGHDRGAYAREEGFFDEVEHGRRMIRKSPGGKRKGRAARARRTQRAGAGAEGRLIAACGATARSRCASTRVRRKAPTESHPTRP